MSRYVQGWDKITTHLFLEFTCNVLRSKYDATYRLAQYAEVRTMLSLMRAPPQRSVVVPFLKMATCNRRKVDLLINVKTIPLFWSSIGIWKKKDWGSEIIKLLAPELLFFILVHPVYKMWIIQEPNTLELWNKMHFEEEKTESTYIRCLKYSVHIFLE